VTLSASPRGPREKEGGADGASFDVQKAPKLFGASQRLHSQDDFPGTGVSLATVENVIFRHGGRI
jgi:light-regulated signal transduction histidine kinase (bacteriophytochrome)